MKQTQQLIYYIATQEDTVITFNAIDMKIAAHSDASCLSKIKAISRAGGNFFLLRNATIP